MKAIYCFRRLGTSTIGYCTEITKSHKIIVHIFFVSVSVYVFMQIAEKGIRLKVSLMKLGKNFVKYLVRFLGNGVSRKMLLGFTDL